MNLGEKEYPGYYGVNNALELSRVLKKLLKSTPILVPFDNKLQIVVTANASSVGVRCAIYHCYPDGTDKPISYASKTLTSAERNYSLIEREALAIRMEELLALKKFRTGI